MNFTLPDWLLPFALSAMGLVAVFSATLVWALGPRAATPGAAPARVPVWQQAALGWLLPPLAVLMLYAALGHPRALNPAERAPDEISEMAARVDRLADRLATEPGDSAGWLMLGRSLKVLGRVEEAADAYARAGPAAHRDPDVLADWIEARILAQDQRFDATSLALLAEVMALAPEHPGVLLLRGLAALDRGDLNAARHSFDRLRQQHAEGSPDRLALDRAVADLSAGRDPRRSAAGATEVPGTAANPPPPTAR